MNKHLILALAACTFGSSLAWGQGATDAFKLSQTQLRGTARFLSMGGAFGALGGDLSTLTQNPAGIGVYRSSEVGATLDVDLQRTTLQGTGAIEGPYTHKQTRAACNNFGYVGAVSLNNNVMPYFQWGVTYNRANSFERRYRGYFPEIQTSWTNYVAEISNGYSPDDLLGDDAYDPFFDSDVAWISALAYNSMLINPNPTFDASNPASRQYLGLFEQGLSQGDAQVEVTERGYVDEYSLNLGGNFADIVYWGLGFGISDLSFTRTTYYDEQISSAITPNPNDNGLEIGAAEWGIENYQHMSGSGFNVKFGVIVKPINELRLGLAVHSPTWYNLGFTQSAWTDYGLGYIEQDGYYTHDSQLDVNPFAETGDGYFARSLKTPWRLMASAAGVVGGRFIISADYVYEAYPSMSFSDDWGEFADVSADIKQYYKPSSEVRVGAEFRATPKLSVRAGYALKSSGVKQQARDGHDYIYTTGTQTMYEFNGNRHNISAGLGYRFGMLYADLAYVHSTQTGDWSAFTPFPLQEGAAYAPTNNALAGPRAKLRDTHNHLVLTLGLKF